MNQRSTVCSGAQESGRARDVVMTMMGDSAGDMTSRWDRVDEAILSRAVDGIEACLASVHQTVTQEPSQKKNPLPRVEVTG